MPLQSSLFYTWIICAYASNNVTITGHDVAMLAVLLPLTP